MSISVLEVLALILLAALWFFAVCVLPTLRWCDCGKWHRFFSKCPRCGA